MVAQKIPWRKQLSVLALPLYFFLHNGQSRPSTAGPRPRPKISLGTSLHSMKSNVFFFVWHIFWNSPKKVIFTHRKRFLNTNLINTQGSIHFPVCESWQSTMPHTTKWHETCHPSWMYDLHLRPLSHGVVTYCNKDLRNKSLLKIRFSKRTEF